MESLGIQGSSFLFQIINFVILIIGLNYFLYKPVKAMMHKREKKVAQSLRDADKIEARLLKVESDIKEQMDRAAEKSELVIGEAKKAANEVKSEIKAQAQKESEKMLEDAQARIAAQEQQMLERVEKQVAALARVATEKVLSEYLSESDRKKITEKAMVELSKSIK